MRRPLNEAESGYLGVNRSGVIVLADHLCQFVEQRFAFSTQRFCDGLDDSGEIIRVHSSIFHGRAAYRTLSERGGHAMTPLGQPGPSMGLAGPG